MADDEDAVYVDVIPRLDDRATDEAVGKLQDKFSSVTTSLGDSLKTSASDAFHDIGTRAQSWGDDVSRKLADTLSDALEGGRYGDIVGDMSRTFKDSLSGVGDLGGKLGDIFGDLKSGDLREGIGGLSDVLKDLHIDGLDKLSSALDGMGGKFDKINDLVTNAGKIASGNPTDMISGAKAVADGLGIPLPPELSAGRDALNYVNQNPDKVDDFLNRIPGMGVATNLLHNYPEMAANAIKGHGFTMNAPPEHLGVEMGNLPNLDRAMRVGVDGGAGGAFPSSISTSSMGVTASVVNIGGVGAIASHSAISGAASSASGAGSAGGGIPTPKRPSSHSSIGSAGALPGRASGGYLPGDSPGYDNLIGQLPGGQVFGLEGGEAVLNPDAASNPIVHDLVGQWNGGNLPGYAGGTGKVGLDGPGTEPPKAPEMVGGTGPKPGPGNGKKQPESELGPHGTGQGFGISGGILGTAESAAAMAASMSPAGPAGGAAVQAASQEMNRAIGYMGQMAGILAIEAPLDTLSVHGGKLADMGQSWIGKLGGGIAGAHHDTQNVAGQTQPPIAPPSQDAGSDVGGTKSGGRTPGVHIENMNVNNTNGGSSIESSLQRAQGMAYNSSSPA